MVFDFVVGGEDEDVGGVVGIVKVGEDCEIVELWEI